MTWGNYDSLSGAPFLTFIREVKPPILLQTLMYKTRDEEILYTGHIAHLLLLSMTFDLEKL